MIQQILTAGRFPADPATLAGTVLLLESSEEVIPAHEFSRILRAIGERGIRNRTLLAELVPPLATV